MRILRWLGIALATLVAALLLLVVAGRFSDGPRAIIAGGPLTSGEFAADPGDWSFVRDIGEVELQLVEPPDRAFDPKVVWRVVRAAASRSTRPRAATG